MSIVIYTYSDPYHLPNESYWKEIKSCPYFCASQTLVNGLKVLYDADFQQGRVTTVDNLLENLYPDWESAAALVKQHALIDRIIMQGIDHTLEPEMQHNLLGTFIFNREEVFKSIRVLFELKVNPSEIVIDKLTPEQKLIINIYKAIIDSKDSREFIIKEQFSEDEINEALNSTMQNANSNCNVAAIPKECIVIHGIHQFTPIMLRCIEQLSQFKKVILLFNYQSQYASVYQTWIDIYGAFDIPIEISKTPEFSPNYDHKQSYRGNLLADVFGKMINGNMQGIHQQDDVEILEFENVTEFASYVASLYLDAVKSGNPNALTAMREQIYSADSSVNNILKMYFPEQFGERQFLNYPLGHYFVAISNMWDPEQNKVYINDLNDIKECFNAGILPENSPGQLSTIYGKISVLFEDCTDIEQMISRLKKVQRSRKNLHDEERISRIRHISYYSISTQEIEIMIKALTELNDLAAYFYEDFENTAHNFREFYKKLRAYIQDQSVDVRKLGEEYNDILRRVLERLQEVEDIDASASFECLKATMNIYLVQQTKPGKGANWIVRNFEQIDGDILRSFKHPDAATYHFACLSDEDINAVKSSEFSWPLDSNFFEIAQEPIDWKYQVYVKSCKEYRNFKKYALLYGMEFNRSKFKMSYVKRDGDKDQTLYSLLRILGLKVKPYKLYRKDREIPDVSGICVNSDSNGTFTEFDYCRFRICQYRFLLESVLESDTVYKDAFLLGKYLEVCLENIVKTQLESTPISEVILLNKLEDAFDEVKRYFPFVQKMNRMDMINTIRNRIIANKCRIMPKLSPDQLRYMKIRELFIHQTLSDVRTHRTNVLADKLSPVSNDFITEKLSNECLTGLSYLPNVDVWCQYCSNRETCVASYTLNSSEEAN